MKKRASIFGVFTATLFLLIFVFTVVFVAYIYALQYNPGLFVPGFSGYADKAIRVIWRSPYMTPTPSPEPGSVLVDTPRPAPELVGITRWYEDREARIGQYRGNKIVVLVFGRLYCTYCQNVYTYLTEWQRNYGSDYIQVIAIQSPKYDGEKVWEDVVKEIKERDVNFPVGFDENRQTRDAYGIDWVPLVHVIDKNGMIRFTHQGEGYFSRTEDAIRELITKD